MSATTTAPSVRVVLGPLHVAWLRSALAAPRLADQPHDEVLRTDLAALLDGAMVYTPASSDEIADARAAYGSDEVEVDDDACVSDPGDGSGYWVQAWVWIAEPGDDEETTDDDAEVTP